MKWVSTLTRACWNCSIQPFPFRSSSSLFQPVLGHEHKNIRAGQAYQTVHAFTSISITQPCLSLYLIGSHWIIAVHYIMESNLQILGEIWFKFVWIKKMPLEITPTVEIKQRDFVLLVVSYLFEVRMGTLQLLIWLSSVSDTSIWRGSRGIHTFSSSWALR